MSRRATLSTTKAGPSTLLVASLGILILSFGSLASASGIRERWRIPIDSSPENSFMASIGTKDGKLFTADARGVIFAFRANDGMMLWTVDGNSSLAGLIGAPGANAVIGIYGINEGIFGFAVTKFEAYDGDTGTTLWSMEAPNGTQWNLAQVAISSPNGHTLILNELLTIQWINARTGHVVKSWTAPPVGGLFEPSTLSTLTVVDYDEFVPPPAVNETMRRLLVWNSTTGELYCNRSLLFYNSTVASTDSFSSAADGLLQQNVPFFSNATDLEYWTLRYFDVHQGCHELEKERESDISTVGGISDGRYLYQVLSVCADDPRKLCNYTSPATNISRVGVDPVTRKLKYHWNLTVYNWSIDTVSVLPFDDHAVIFGVGPDLINLNTRDGSTNWEISMSVPTAPFNVGGPSQLLFPLGNRQLFIPNLQGWVVIKGSENGSWRVVERNEMTPIVSTTTFSDENGPFVVYVDLLARALVAVEGVWD